MGFFWETYSNYLESKTTYTFYCEKNILKWLWSGARNIESNFLWNYFVLFFFIFFYLFTNIYDFSPVFFKMLLILFYLKCLTNIRDSVRSNLAINLFLLKNSATKNPFDDQFRLQKENKLFTKREICSLFVNNLTFYIY